MADGSSMERSVSVATPGGRWRRPRILGQFLKMKSCFERSRFAGGNPSFRILGTRVIRIIGGLPYEMSIDITPALLERGRGESFD